MREISSRVTWLMAVLALGLISLSGQLYRLSVTQSAAWRVQAQDQMLRELANHGPRGIIYDRQGRSLATSEPAFAAVLINQDLDEVSEFLPRLALILAENDSQKALEIESRVMRMIHDNEDEQYRPLTLQTKLTQEMVTILAERRQEFPGLHVVEESVRNYGHGSLAGAVLGYVGQIGETELKDPAYAELGYLGDEVVGKAGLEKYYQHQLRGKPGTYSVVADAYGRRVNDLGEDPPKPGNNIHLTLDMDLQRVAEEALAKQIAWIKAKNDPKAKPVRGSLVVQDVRTGAVLAMVSVPTYDPNIMTRGLSDEEWAVVSQTPGYFYNWAITGFAPGSTFKMATGLAGLEAGVVGPREQIDCAARYWKYGGPRNWNGAQGYVDITRALAISCNPYFFEVGDRLGIDRMAELYGKIGFGKPTGVDLPDEDPGMAPTEASYAERWFPGQVVNVAIGQGDVLATPLQLANYVGAIATGGQRYRPYLVEQIRSSSGEVVMEHQPERLDTLETKPEYWKLLQQGMRRAVTTVEGTAHLGFVGWPSDIPVAGKTGSAETGSGYAHALSVAYAPYDKPEIAVSVIIEGGSSGGWTTPIIRRVMAAYFGVKDVIPDGVPTYREPHEMPARRQPTAPAQPPAQTPAQPPAQPPTQQQPRP